MKLAQAHRRCGNKSIRIACHVRTSDEPLMTLAWTQSANLTRSETAQVYRPSFIHFRYLNDPKLAGSPVPLPSRALLPSTNEHRWNIRSSTPRVQTPKSAPISLKSIPDIAGPAPTSLEHLRSLEQSRRRTRSCYALGECFKTQGFEARELFDLTRRQRNPIGLRALSGLKAALGWQPRPLTHNGFE